MTNNKTFKMG